MDQQTFDLLEFDSIRQFVSGYAATTLGKQKVADITPGCDAGKIRAELNLVTEMTEALQSGQSPPFGGIHDVRLILRRAEIGTMLTAEQLLQIADTLTATGAIYRYRSRLEGRYAKLIELLVSIDDLGGVARTVTTCIDGRAHVVDSASAELGAIRESLAELDERAKNEIAKLLRDPKIREILRYSNATVNGDHYVLPVAANHRQKVPGIVHRSSGTGETLFIEPAALASLSSERSYLKSEEDRETKKILRRLSAEVGRHAKQLAHALEIIAHLDLVTAKARYAADYRMSCPEIDEEGRLWLRQARHPILENIFRHTLPVVSDPSHPAEKRQVVPVDLRLGHGFRMLVVTGPNTGGKTVALKTVGLLCAMALSGLHIPADAGSQVPLLEHILADIGDEQNLQQSLSTFSSHITRIAGILRQANPRSLILFDELGAGTDPTEGAALGRAILDHLDASGCLSIVTTHLGDLKTYAFTNDNAENGAVEFDIETLRPTYRLFIGQFGMSNALKDRPAFEAAPRSHSAGAPLSEASQGEGGRTDSAPAVARRRREGQILGDGSPSQRGGDAQGSRFPDRRTAEEPP